jgi:hypothetical protein
MRIEYEKVFQKKMKTEKRVSNESAAVLLKNSMTAFHKRDACLDGKRSKPSP